VRVGEPGVHGRQPGLRAVADQQEHECQAEHIRVQPGADPRKDVQCRAYGRLPARLHEVEIASTVPTERQGRCRHPIRMYFHDASSADRVRRRTTRNAVVIVVASTATHMTPRLFTMTARSIVNRKRLARNQVEPPRCLAPLAEPERDPADAGHE